MKKNRRIRQLDVFLSKYLNSIYKNKERLSKIYLEKIREQIYNIIFRRYQIFRKEREAYNDKWKNIKKLITKKNI